MAYVNGTGYDQALNWIRTKAGRLDICSVEPSSFTEATSTYTLGNKTPITVSSPADDGSSGREVTVSAISDGTVTGTGNAAYWAITDGSSILVASGALAAEQAVSNGNEFTLSSFTIDILDATDA